MFHLNKKNVLLKTFLVSCLFLSVFVSAKKVEAASLYFSPASGAYGVGDIIKVSVFVDSQNTPINSAEAGISFPADLLNVVSVSKTNSIFTFWTGETVFSNTDGSISFSGGLPTPGYNGTVGKVSDITFKVKKPGSATLTFTSGSVRANDGLGTDILQSRKQASFVLNPKKEVVSEPFSPVAPATPVANVSSEIKITSLDLKEISRADATFPQAKFNIVTKGDLSVIDHFEFQISGKKPETWNDDGTHIYETPVLPPGNYSIVAKVFDKDGNFASSSEKVFVIDPLKTPSVTDFPKEALTSDALTIKGLSYPLSQVQIYIQKGDEDPKVFLVETDQNGVFSFVPSADLSSGTYRFWVEALNERGAKSLPGEKNAILVTKLPFVKFGTWNINLIYILIPLALVFLFLILVILYFWYKFTTLKKQNKKENYNVSKEINDTFGLFIGDMKDRVKMLEKARGGRILTTEEENIVKQDKTDLSMVDSLVKKD